MEAIRGCRERTAVRWELSALTARIGAEISSGCFDPLPFTMRAATFIAGACVFACAFHARAQTSGLPVLDLERLELDHSATGSLLVGNGELLPERTLRLELAIHYERDPLRLEID